METIKVERSDIEKAIKEALRAVEGEQYGVDVIVNLNGSLSVTDCVAGSQRYYHTLDGEQYSLHSKRIEPWLSSSYEEDYRDVNGLSEGDLDESDFYEWKESTLSEEIENGFDVIVDLFCEELEEDDNYEII